MRYPYQKFLRFLVSRKVELGPLLERYGLPQVGELWVARTRTELRKSGPYELRKYLDGISSRIRPSDEFLSWARDEGFVAFWQAQPEFGGTQHPHLYAAHQIFADPVSRGTMSMLVMSRMTDYEIVEFARDSLDMEINEGTVAFYRDIFWNPIRMSGDDWTSLLETIPSADERHLVALGLRRISKETAADALSSESPRIEHEFVVNQIITKSYEQFRSAINHPTPMTHNAIKWAELALKAITTAKTTGIKVSDENSLMATGFAGMFNVQVTKTEHPTIADLQGELGLPSKKSKEGS